MGDATSEKRSSSAWFMGICAGMLVAIAAWSWSFMQQPADVWSPEQAKSLQAARDAVHSARGGGLRVSDDSKELERAQAVVDRLEIDLEEARTFRGRWASRVGAGGLALTIFCGLGYLATRGD
ncbi:hypothetical protein [Lacipirellula parvula]|uniref:Uncharacterized protein n=1 Tax=Lacipirellula parvula TaxID=2650471 RepID=A0A5K7X8E4_9BACT|nr:hypothetical protein [Lacipirellula parvula]BBO30576.1 hypothetical protein PLANPX_0188 [Lacipirellula parvula]